MTAIAERPPVVDQCVGSNHRPGCEHFPAAVRQVFEELSIDVVDVGANVRVDPGELEELAATIREHGVLQPVGAVGPDAKGRYSLVFGQRRVLASKLAGRSIVPALVRATAEAGKPGAKRSLEQLVENIARADLNAVDEARALAMVLEADPKLTQAELAKRLGRSAPWVANALGLLRLPDSVQKLVAGDKLAASHARAIAGLAPADQTELAEKAVAQDWSAHDLERQARWAKENAKGRAVQREREAKMGVDAIASLEKTAAKDATIVVVAGAIVANAIRKAGWKDVRTNLHYGQYGHVEQAGKCGCAAWVVEGYQAVSVKPGCIDRDHIAARKKAENDRWEAERAKDSQKRQAETAARTRRAEGIGAWLAGILDGPLARRLVLYALLNDGVDEGFIKRYVDDPDARGLDGGEIWTAILKVPEDKLALEIGEAAGATLLEWGVSEEALAIIDAALPPAKPAKAKKAAKA